MENLTKKCTKCKIIKAIDEFYFTRPGIKFSYCKTCACKIQKNRRSKQSYISQINVYRKCAYGVSKEEFERKAREQDNRCYICKKKCKLVVDHFHGLKGLESVRDLLCAQCNAALGFVYENPIIIKSLLNYINKWSYLKDIVQEEVNYLDLNKALEVVFKNGT